MLISLRWPPNGCCYSWGLGRPENPRVGGSTPSQATNPFNRSAAREWAGDRRLSSGFPQARREPLAPPRRATFWGFRFCSSCSRPDNSGRMRVCRRGGGWELGRPTPLAAQRPGGRSFSADSPPAVYREESFRCREQRPPSPHSPRPRLRGTSALEASRSNRGSLRTDGDRPLPVASHAVVSSHAASPPRSPSVSGQGTGDLGQPP